MKTGFSEYMSGNGIKSYMWSDDPFVVTVLCIEGERGYFVDWWVSGKRHVDDRPVLLIRLKAGVSVDAEDLELTLIGIWENSLREVAFGSAIFGGVKNNPHDLNALPDKLRRAILSFQLEATSRLGHFNILGNSKIEKTANMYLLLKSFGSNQPQKQIAEFESFPLVREVKPAIINQRLALAKKAGMLQPNALGEKFLKYVITEDSDFNFGNKESQE